MNLIVTVRKLKPYFLAHPINVLTNLPLRQVLHKPDLSRRSSKWDLELSEYHIDFSPRKTIQGQTLAHFLVKCTLSENSDDNNTSQDRVHVSLTWILNVGDSFGTEHKRGKLAWCFSF